MTELVTRAEFARRAADALLADADALAAFEVGALSVDEDVGALVDAALARRYRDRHRPEDVTLLAAD
jgi:hypothetical protein